MIGSCKVCDSQNKMNQEEHFFFVLIIIWNDHLLRGIITSRLFGTLLQRKIYYLLKISKNPVYYNLQKHS